jgi:hypothetical protein
MAGSGMRFLSARDALSFLKLGNRDPRGFLGGEIKPRDSNVLCSASGCVTVFAGGERKLGMLPRTRRVIAKLSPRGADVGALKHAGPRLLFRGRFVGLGCLPRVCAKSGKEKGM